MDTPSLSQHGHYWGAINLLKVMTFSSKINSLPWLHETSTKRSDLATSSHCRAFSLQDSSLCSRSMRLLASLTQTHSVVRQHVARKRSLQ